MSNQVEEPCLSVVVPCYNEQATVRELVHRVLQSPVVGQIVIVDDASTDGSWKEIESIDDPRVTTARHAFNMGKGAAIAYGISKATQEFVVVQDADLEYDPEEYPKLLEPLLAGQADAVYGSRFHNQRPHRVLYYWHSVGNKILTTASNMVTNLNLTDMETCYKMCRTELLQSIELEEDRFGVEPEMTAKLAQADARIYEVGISYHGRTYDEGKKIGWKDGVRAFYCIVKYARRRDPFPTLDEVDSASTSQNRLAPFSVGASAQGDTDTICDLVAPHLGSNVVEVGGGTGAITTGLVERLRSGRSDWNYTVADADAGAAEALTQRFASNPHVAALQADPLAALEAVQDCDSIVAINLLERLEDDQEFVRQAATKLGDGVLALWVPAGRALYSEADKKLGHYRRYTPSSLRRVLTRGGFVPELIEYQDAGGALAWWLMTKKLGRDTSPETRPGLYDRVATRAEQAARPPFGQSLFCIARARHDIL